jgi:hypothetical protein
VRMGFRERHLMRFLVENYPYVIGYEVMLPTFPEVSACFEILIFVMVITFVLA